MLSQSKLIDEDTGEPYTRSDICEDLASGGSLKFTIEDPRAEDEEN